MKKLAFVGAGTHSDAVFQIIRTYSHKFVGYFDDKNICEYNTYPIIGKTKDVIKALDNGEIDCVFVTIGDNKRRKELFEAISVKHYDKIINVVADSAIILNSDALNGNGIFIGHNVFLGADVLINDNTIINTNSVVEHHSKIDAHCNLTPSTTINGIVHISECCYIGSNSTIIQCIDICEDAIIGAGAVVVRNIESPGTYVGIPAKKLEGVDNAV